MGVAPSRRWCLRNHNPFDWRRTEADRRKLSTRHQRYCTCVRGQSLVRFMTSYRGISNSLARNPQSASPVHPTCRSNFNRPSRPSGAKLQPLPRRAAAQQFIFQIRVMHGSPRAAQETRYRREAANFLPCVSYGRREGGPRRAGIYEIDFHPVAAHR